MTAEPPWVGSGLPGWTPPPIGDGRRLTTFAPADLAGRWSLDFHTPRGLVPLAIALVDDLAAGARAAADELGLPGGLQARLVGCHLYVGLGPGPSGTADAAGTAGAADAAGTAGTADAAGSGTAQRVPTDACVAELTTYARDFRAHWARLAAELTGALDALDAVDLPTLSEAELLAHWRRARAVHAQAWRVHFAVMYRLMTLHEHYLAVCRPHGVSEVDATKMIEGEENTIAAAHRAVRGMADAARSGGFAHLLLRTPTTRLRAALQREPEAREFLAELARVQAVYGRRTSSLFDLETAPWSADPTPVLALVRSALLAGPPRESWGTADARRLGESVLARLDPAAAAEVRAAWDLAVAGNASWWNEEHNHVIDLRAHLPVADVARETARRSGRPVRDIWHLLAEEFEELLAGATGWDGLATVVAERAAYTTRCRARRRELPPGLGSGQGVPDDVVFRQVMGFGGPVDHVTDAPLQGYGVSPGVGRGTVRVVQHAEDIVLLRQGDVLVCEATSPSWTPAFDRIAAAVCDGGGLLTHAAIISREYGVPCVCATFTGTTTLRDGDLVEVDGGAGTVTLLRRRTA